MFKFLINYMDTKIIFCEKCYCKQGSKKMHKVNLSNQFLPVGQHTNKLVF